MLYNIRMTEARWAEVVAHIKDNLTVTDHYLDDFADGFGSAEVYEVEHDLGTLRFVYESIPRRTDSRALYSKRGNSVARVADTYDLNDIVHSFRIERWDDDANTWVELSSDPNIL